MNTPRSGSLAKACTELSTPERTRNVPIRLKEKPAMASSSVQLLNAPVLFRRHHRMDQRGGDQPGHQRGVLRPGPRTRSRPSRAYNRPTTNPARCRASAPSTRPARTGARRAPRPHRCACRAAPPPQRRTPPTVRHSRDKEAADGRRDPGPATAGSGRCPSNGGGSSRANGSDVSSTKTRNAIATSACTPSARAFSPRRRPRHRHAPMAAE